MAKKIIKKEKSNNKKMTKKTPKDKIVTPEEDDKDIDPFLPKNRKANEKAGINLEDEPKDPLEVMDEDDSDDLDPTALSKRGLHIETGDDFDIDDPVDDPIINEEEEMWDDDELGYGDEKDQW